MADDDYPSDLLHIRHTWARAKGDAWTTKAFRTPVVVWLDSFLDTHSWARSVSIVEKFHVPGINRKTPFGRTGRASDPRTYEAGFRQSNAPAVLVITAIRGADQEPMEVSLPFPRGAQTDLISLDFYLARARESLEALEARTPFA